MNRERILVYCLLILVALWIIWPLFAGWGNYYNPIIVPSTLESVHQHLQDPQHRDPKELAGRVENTQSVLSKHYRLLNRLRLQSSVSGFLLIIMCFVMLYIVTRGEKPKGPNPYKAHDVK